MFIDFISRILGAEKVSVSNRLENNAEPSVIIKKDSTKPIPEKYQRDIEALRQKYGDAFKTGLCINLTLQEALSVMPRDRKSRFLCRTNILSKKRTGNYTNH